MATQKSLKPGNELEPPVRVRVPPTFRPSGSLKHLVSDGEDWHSLGKRYKVEALDIIKSNYRTTKPEYINWYLHFYVACDTPTRDRYNWTFTTSARNGAGSRAGIIYVKPNWPLVLVAAKIATNDFLKTWFSRVAMAGATVAGSMLTVQKGSLFGPKSFGEFEFMTKLRFAGLPDDLAAAVSSTVRFAITDFIENFHASNPDAFPGLLSVPAGRQIPAVMIEPWPMFSQATSESLGFVSADLLAAKIRARMIIEAVHAGPFIGPYTRWFEAVFFTFASLCAAAPIQASGSFVHGNPLAHGPAMGMAFAAAGFIKPGSMPL